VPTAATLADAQPPCVVKADGLTGGKGVFVCRDAAQVEAALAAARAFGGPVLVEELLTGSEASLFALCDGETARPLPVAQDYKRAFDGDEGPNTGGMGSYSPVPGLDGEWTERVLDLVHRPVLAELSARGTPFSGLLYAGLMLTRDGPKVLEFNVRFGDPETQSILPRLDGDLLAALAGAAAGRLPPAAVSDSNRAAVAIVVAAGDYPAAGDQGSPITGIGEAESAGALVFHAGTARRGGELVTNGGRVLNVVGVGNDVESARATAYEGASRISFAGARYRSDIARG
jgi:phosphoribosylamine--glycine ligase